MSNEIPQICRSVFLDSARFDPGGDWPRTCLTCSKQSTATCWSRGIETTFWGTRCFKVQKKAKVSDLWSFFSEDQLLFLGSILEVFVLVCCLFCCFLFGWVMSMLLDFSICLRCTRYDTPSNPSWKPRLLEGYLVMYMCVGCVPCIPICFYDRLISKVVDIEFDTQTSGFCGGWTNESIIGFIWFHY